MIRDRVQAHSIMVREGGTNSAYDGTNIQWIDASLAQLEDIVLCLTDLAEQGAMGELGHRGENSHKDRTVASARREMRLIGSANSED